MRENEIIEAVKKIIVSHFDPKRIILFGSRAKGCNDSHADFDFAVDCQKPDIAGERKIKEDIDPAVGLYSVHIVFLPAVDVSFKEIILETGKVIYEK